MQERENCSVADTTFFDRGLNLSLTSVCVGIGLAYCFMFILLVAKAFLRPDGDSWTQREKHTVNTQDCGFFREISMYLVIEAVS